MVVCFISSVSQVRHDGGTGDANDPYQIATAEQMNDIGKHEGDWDKHFILVHDVNLAPYPDEQSHRIGKLLSRTDPNKRPFTGVFDGRGKKIVGFTWTSKDKHGVGLFACLGKRRCRRTRGGPIPVQ
jgi:hypothetical protein